MASKKVVTPITGRDVTAGLNGAAMSAGLAPFGSNGAHPDTRSAREERPRKTFTVLSADEAMALQPLPGILGNILYARMVAVLYARTQRWKSFIALSWALAIASGMDWLGHPVTPGGVIYVSGEGGHAMGKRIKAWTTHYKPKQPLRFGVIPEAAHLLDPEHFAGLCDAIRASVATTLGGAPPTLLVLDTLRLAMTGFDENATKDAGLLIAAARALTVEFGSCVLLVHHVGHEVSHPRGSSVFINDPDIVIKVAAETDSAQRLPVGAIVRLHSEKNKDDEQWPDIALTTLRSEWSEVTIEQGRTVERNISSLVIITPNLRGGLRPTIPTSPSKGEFGDAALACWKALSKRVASHGAGLSRAEWFTVSVAALAMGKSTFYDAARKLLDAGWVVERDARCFPANPYAPDTTEADAWMGVDQGDGHAD